MMSIKIAGGVEEDGIVIGNAYDKYNSRNPLARRMVTGFDDALSSLVSKIQPKTIHEVGCGEGYWVMRWLAQGIETRGSDFSKKVIGMARAEARERGLDATCFEARSIYEMAPERDSADLIVCCEVMEHLEEPERAMRVLQGIVGADLIISVPREPLWRILNMARCKYLSDFGNTPGHLQHWSKGGITALVQRYFEVVEVLSPLPWTMIHCRRKQS